MRAHSKPMRRRYVWDPELKELVEIPLERIPVDGGPHVPYVWRDIESYQSPVDGTVITDRKQHREHLKQHNMAPVEDFKDTWRRASEERAKHMNGTHPADRAARISALRDAFEHVRNQQIARGKWH